MKKFEVLLIFRGRGSVIFKDSIKVGFVFVCRRSNVVVNKIDFVKVKNEFRFIIFENVNSVFGSDIVTLFNLGKSD